MAPPHPIRALSFILCLLIALPWLIVNLLALFRFYILLLRFFFLFSKRFGPFTENLFILHCSFFSSSSFSWFYSLRNFSSRLSHLYAFVVLLFDLSFSCFFSRFSWFSLWEQFKICFFVLCVGCLQRQCSLNWKFRLKFSSSSSFSSSITFGLLVRLSWFAFILLYLFCAPNLIRMRAYQK